MGNNQNLEIVKKHSVRLAGVESKHGAFVVRDIFFKYNR